MGRQKGQGYKALGKAPICIQSPEEPPEVQDIAHWTPERESLPDSLNDCPRWNWSGVRRTANQDGRCRSGRNTVKVLKTQARDVEGN